MPRPVFFLWAAFSAAATAGIVVKGAIPKVDSAVAAIRSGVEMVSFVDGRVAREMGAPLIDLRAMSRDNPTAWAGSLFIPAARSRC